MVSTFTIDPPQPPIKPPSPSPSPSPSSLTPTPPPPYIQIPQSNLLLLPSRTYQQPFSPADTSPTSHKRRPHYPYTTPWTPPPLMPSSNPTTTKPSTKPGSLKRKTESSPRQNAGVLDKYSLFPNTTASRSPSPAQGSAKVRKVTEDTRTSTTSSETQRNSTSSSSGDSTLALPPPSRALPPLPLRIDKKCPAPPPLDLVHPAFRSRMHMLLSPTDSDTDTGSIPICLDEHEGPPAEYKPVLHLTSLRLRKMELEAHLRMLEGTFGRYGASGSSGVGAVRGGNVYGDRNREEGGQGQENKKREGGTTPPPPYQSQPSSASSTVVTETKKSRRRGSENESASSTKTGTGTGTGKTTSTEEEKNTYATRPTYGKDKAAHFLGAKTFEVLRGVSLTRPVKFSRKEEVESPSAELLEPLLLYSPVTPRRRNRNAFIPERTSSLDSSKNFVLKSCDQARAQTFPITVKEVENCGVGKEKDKPPESPHYTNMIALLRTQYQETELMLAETDLEIEIVYMRSQIEQIRSKKNRVRGGMETGMEVGKWL